MQGRITKRAVDTLSTPASGEMVLWDTEIKGFGIRARGGGKSYILHYRAGSGRSAPLRKVTIGRHGSPWTPDQARLEAKRLLGEVASGKDPAKVRRDTRNTSYFGELIDLYLAEGCGHKKPSTLKADRGRIEHHLRPLLGKLRIDAIKRVDVERMRDAVAAGRTAEKLDNDEKRPSGSLASGGTGVAAQCVLLVSTIFSFGIDRGLCTDNPARGVKKARVRKLERFLSTAETARLAEALEAEEKVNPFAVAAIRLLLLTGCRKGEILSLRWEHIDFERQVLRLPDAKESKGEAKIVYLNPPALTVLTGIPRLSETSLVIPPARRGGEIAAIDKAWWRVREAAGLPDVRIHDLRHSFASVGAAGGWSLPIIGALLGHKHSATTARYAHLSADPLRAANNAVGARIAAAMRLVR